MAKYFQKVYFFTESTDMKSDSSFEKSLTCKQISSSYFELSVLAIFLAYYLYQISISDFILFLSEPHPLFSNYTVIVFNFIIIWPQSCIVICWAQGYNFRRTTVQLKESGCSTLKYQLYEILWKKGHWVLTLNFCACLHTMFYCILGGSFCAN